MRKLLVVFGAGGAARDVQHIVAKLPEWELYALIEQEIEEWTLHQIRDFHAVIGIGTPSIIRAVRERLESREDIQWPNLIHPRADTDGIVQIGSGNIIASGATFAADVSIGHCNNINLNATIGHDTKMGNYCVICPGAHLSGFTTLEDEVFIGTGAVILPGVQIGSGAVVGAGAVVTRNVPARKTVVGVPAYDKYTGPDPLGIGAERINWT